VLTPGERENWKICLGGRIILKCMLKFRMEGCGLSQGKDRLRVVNTAMNLWPS
jgi:hypothetical protein